MKDLFLFLFFAGIAWLVWRAFTGKPTPHAPAREQPSKVDKEASHLRSTLQFAKDQHRILSRKQREQDAWQQRFGSGEIESSHRYIVQKRLKLPGAWWSPANADHMLALRLNRANKQWDSYWNRVRKAA